MDADGWDADWRTTGGDSTEQWYDLNGRPITKPATKGIYIHNGRKEAVK